MGNEVRAYLTARGHKHSDFHVEHGEETAKSGLPSAHTRGETLRHNRNDWLGRESDLAFHQASRRSYGGAELQENEFDRAWRDLHSSLREQKQSEKY